MKKVGKHNSDSLLIKGGHVIDPAGNLDEDLDILLRDGLVAEIAEAGQIRGTGLTFDASGLIVCPGLIDIHVHLREPGQSYKETIASGTAAAAAGGFTSVCSMPNTLPVSDTAEIIEWQQSLERGAVVNVFPIAAATYGSQGGKLTDFAALQKAGAVAVTDDGKPILSDDIMRETLLAAAKLNLPVIQHAEDTRMTISGSMNESAASFRLGLHGMPSAAESSIVERDIQLARQIAGSHIHVAHLSTAGALEAVRRGKREGERVTCEVTPHHFTLTDADIVDYDANFKMNPPLRAAADVEALLLGLEDGTVDAIATDHAPHALHEKIIEFQRAAFGIIGLETALGLAIKRLHHERKVPLRRVIELFTSGPARVLDLKGRGSLSIGNHADITIFDPKKKWKYDVSKSPSMARNTPFDGYALIGKVMATIIAGKIVFEG